MEKSQRGFIPPLLLVVLILAGIIVWRFWPEFQAGLYSKSQIQTQPTTVLPIEATPLGKIAFLRPTGQYFLPTLTIYDFSTKKTTVPSSVRVGVENIIWSPNGKKFALFYKNQDSVADSQTNKYVTIFRNGLDIYDFDEWVKTLNEHKEYQPIYIPDPSLLEPLEKQTNLSTLFTKSGSWSSDNKRLAYWRSQKANNEYQLIILDTEDQKEQVVLNDKTGNFNAILPSIKWSPSGKNIIYSPESDRNLWIMDTSTLKSGKIVDSNNQPLSSYHYDFINNDEVILNTSAGKLEIINLNSKTLNEIADRNVYSFSLSPNRSKISYYESNNSEQKDEQWGINVIELSKGTPTRVLISGTYKPVFESDMEDPQMSWSPDSEFVAVTLIDKRNDKKTVLIVSVKNKKLIKLPELENSYMPRWNQ